MNNKTEHGRSMVEMLGVLAVIGVLSVGGVAGYTHAMDRHKVNQIMNFFDIAMVSIDDAFRHYGTEKNWSITVDGCEIEYQADLSGFVYTSCSFPFSEGACRIFANQFKIERWDFLADSPLADRYLVGSNDDGFWLNVTGSWYTFPEKDMLSACKNFKGSDVNFNFTDP